MSVSSVGREEQSLPAEIRDLEAILARISAGASARDAHPAFPEDPFVRLAPTGALAIPVPDPIGTKSRRASFAEEWRVLRAIAGADGSVGRILEPFSKRMNLSEKEALSFQRLATKELIAEC